MLSMRGLECLVAIVDEGSLTKAAAVLHMSQPALSHQIAAIERELGTPVIERLPRGIRPTAAGLMAVAEARIALAAASKVVTSARGAAAGTSGRIRIACAETMTGWLLAPVLRSWHRRFPEVELDLKEFTSADRMLEVLLAGGADIIVAPPPTVTAEHVENLGARRSWSSPPPGTGSRRWTRCRSRNSRTSRSCTTSRTTAWRRGLTSSRPSAACCCPGPRCAPAARAPPPSWRRRAWASPSCLSPPSRRGRTPPSGPFDPPELRDVIVVVAAPHDALVRRFVADLKARGLPLPRISSPPARRVEPATLRGLSRPRDPGSR